MAVYVTTCPSKMQEHDAQDIGPDLVAQHKHVRYHKCKYNSLQQYSNRDQYISSFVRLYSLWLKSMLYSHCLLERKDFSVVCDKHLTDVTLIHAQV
jgi:hypothetical protein